MGKMSPEFSLRKLARQSLACLLLVGFAQPWALAALAADGDVERTLAIVELRSGDEADPLTSKYLGEIATAFRDEAPGDVILVDGKTTADKVRKDRVQVPTALTDERRLGLTEARKKGVDLLDNADFPGAIKALGSAEAKYRAALAAPGADAKLRDEYLDVLAQLATAYVAAGDKNAASEVFRIVITTFGFKAKVTDDNYRPDVVELFKAEVKKIEKMPKGSVEVSSNPSGARIILGGNDRGATPSTVADLIPGVYGLRLQSGSATSMLRNVKVDGGAAAKVSIDIGFEAHLVLEDDRIGLKYADLKTAEGNVERDATAVGRDLDVNLVCAVGVLEGKLVSFLVDVATGKLVRSANDVKVPKVGISKRAVNKVMVTILGAKADKNVAEVPGPSAGNKPWYGSTPGWVAAGGAVAMLGMGIGLSSYLNLDNVTAYYCADPSQTCTGAYTAANKAEYAGQVEDFKSSAQTKATLSGVGLGLGVALAGVAGYLFYNESTKPADSAQLYLPRGVATPAPALVALPPVSLDKPAVFVAQ